MILLVGASGNVGKEVLRQLSASGRDLRATVRDESKAADMRNAGAEPVVADMSDPASLGKALEGVEAVFVSTTATPTMTDDQINLVNAAKAAGVKRFVKLSVAKADQEGCIYARWHHPVEKAIMDSGMSYTILRPNGFMQNFIMNAGTIQSDSAIYAPVGEGKVSFVDIRDVAEVAAKALTEASHENTVYELTGPAALSHGEIASIIGKAIGKDVNYVPISDEQAHEVFMSWGIGQWFADALLDLFVFYRGNNMDHVADDFTKVTGHKPRSMETFANDFAAAFKG